MTDKIKDAFSIILIALGFIFIVFLFLFLLSEFSLWSRELHAEGKLKRAEILAQAKIERAKGVAEANKIIGDSLKGNEGYLRYLWIDSLQHTKDQIIYIPTEGGLPILEASRNR